MKSRKLKVFEAVSTRVPVMKQNDIYLRINLFNSIWSYLKMLTLKSLTKHRLFIFSKLETQHRVVFNVSNLPKVILCFFDFFISDEYEYAVPNELGKLLPSPLRSIPNSPAAINRLKLLQQKFREVGVQEIPKHSLRMLRKLGDGAFGTVSSIAAIYSFSVFMI